MKLGLLTACLPFMSLEHIARAAATAGFSSLEIAAWPTASQHPHQAAHLDVAAFTTADAQRVQHLMQHHGLSIAALTYCENNLHENRAERERIHQHLRHCIDAAAMLQVPAVTTFIGRDHSTSITSSLTQAETQLRPLTDYAAARGVRLLAENCPMEGWHPDGQPGNLAYSPELWDWMRELGFHLAFDPSHLPWLGIDPYDALDHALDRGMVEHVHAKDIQIDHRARTHHGVFGKTVHRASPTDVGWWQYRVPGRGILDFNRLIGQLYTAGYDGVVAVEHEDPIWSGTPDKIWQGLTIATTTLAPLIVADLPNQGLART
ncbi:sugar phosphate isomerase/epimerase [Saccharothrix sp. AJ9571]|nr:sugar phosphate isomerase/epimerase [Saccharothrix sp. AJ9571]